MGSLTLSTLPYHFRQIALWFIVVLGCGYTTGLVFVAHTTSLTPRGVQERYRGNQHEGDSAASPASAAAPAGTSGPAQDSIQAAAAPAQEEEMKFEKSLPEMLNITHTHMLAMAAFLLPAACIFALSTRPSRRVKSILIVEPFIALLVSFASMWLMRYVHPGFSYLLMASSGSFALCLYAMLLLSFIEIVRPAPASGNEA
ncbi:MAG TPA: hypothetical protein VHI13_19320 [Candidatus Kapabacteria bacterium]|nr:hypothetical protein [Candidatus Kapabacteria bacterium]